MLRQKVCGYPIHFYCDPLFYYKYEPMIGSTSVITDSLFKNFHAASDSF